MDSLTQKVKAFALSEGADLVGVAPVERWKKAPPELSPQGLIPGSKSVFVVGIHHPDTCIELASEPTVYDQGPAKIEGYISHKLNSIAFKIAKLLESYGYESLPVSATWMWRYRPYKNINNSFIPDISHLHAAAAAGLGEIGWAGLLLTPEYGPRQRFISIITEANLEPSPMYSGPSLCDHCFKCVKNCPPKALSKEVEGESIVEIEDKVYRYANKNKWRCAWAETFQFSFDLPIPDKVTEEVILNYTAKYGKQIGWVAGYGCKKFCLPPHLRYEDPRYCQGPRRKRKYTFFQPKDGADRQLTEKVKGIALDKEADLVGIASLEDFKDLSINPKDFLPDVSSVIVIGIGYPQKCSQETKPVESLATSIDLKLGFIALDIAKYLEELGYSVAPKTDLPVNLAAVACGLGRLKNERILNSQEIKPGKFEKDKSGLTPDTGGELMKRGILITPEYKSCQSLLAIVTSAPLVSTKTSVEMLDSKPIPRLKQNNVTTKRLSETLKAFAYEKGVDLIGIAPVERFQSFKKVLSKVAKEKSPYPVITDESGGRDRPFIPKLHYEQIKMKGPQDYLSNAKSIIVLGIHYVNAAMDRAGKPPSEAIGPYMFAQIQTLLELSFSALDIVKFLDERGYQAVPTQDLSGLAQKTASTFCGYIPDATANRYAAIAAGLGELGWHGVVLTPEYGVRQRFISIVTNAELGPDPLYDGPALCKRCFKCVEACPTRALKKDEGVKLEVDNKIFQYGKCEPLRCDWAKRYALVGEEGPRYMGSRTNVLPLEKITPENLCQALKQTDPLQKVWIGIVERCLSVCPLSQDKKGKR